MDRIAHEAATGRQPVQLTVRMTRQRDTEQGRNYRLCVNNPYRRHPGRHGFSSAFKQIALGM